MEEMRGVVVGLDNEVFNVVEDARITELLAERGVVIVDELPFYAKGLKTRFALERMRGYDDPDPVQPEIDRSRPKLPPSGLLMGLLRRGGCLPVERTTSPFFDLSRYE